jgi:protein pelota
MVAERAEDMWHAYNLIAMDDELRSTTIRRVTNETATGSTTTSRVHTILKIRVKGIHFDTQASVLSIKGINIEENAYVKVIFRENFREHT